MQGTQWFHLNTFTAGVRKPTVPKSNHTQQNSVEDCPKESRWDPRGPGHAKAMQRNHGKTTVAYGKFKEWREAHKDWSEVRPWQPLETTKREQSTQN